MNLTKSHEKIHPNNLPNIDSLKRNSLAVFIGLALLPSTLGTALENKHVDHRVVKIPHHHAVHKADHGDHHKHKHRHKLKHKTGSATGTSSITSSPSTNVPILPMPVPDQPCTSNPNFSVGIEDEAAYTSQDFLAEGITRQDVLQEGKELFGATDIRIDVVYGEVMQNGMQNYVSAVETAIANGYIPQITIMGTPDYGLSTGMALSFENPDPALMKSFAYEVASTFGSMVNRYSIWNEPQSSIFLESTSMQDYNALYMAGRAGILEANPNAKIWAGELAPIDVSAWIDDLNSLPNDGIALHIYQLINSTKEYADESNTSLEETEYGNPDTDPQQMKKDLAAIETAKCDNAAEIEFYEVYQNTGDPNFDMGVLPVPGLSTNTDNSKIQ